MSGPPGARPAAAAQGAGAGRPPAARVRRRRSVRRPGPPGREGQGLPGHVRAAGRHAPARRSARILIVVALAIVSVTFAVVGPKLLGNATNVLFEGVVSERSRPG